MDDEYLEDKYILQVYKGKGEMITGELGTMREGTSGERID